MIRNLGTVLTILARQEAAERFFYADVSTWVALSECHSIAKEKARRERRARKHAEAVARRPRRVILREARRRGMTIGSPAWDRFVSRVYANHGYPY